MSSLSDNPNLDPRGSAEQTLDYAAALPATGSEPLQSTDNSFPYEVLHELASGGMGVVYLARHRTLNRYVALKMIHAERVSSQTTRRRFFHEAETAAQLEHPGIVPIYEVGEYQGTPYLCMKLIEGGSLHDRIPALTQDPETSARLLIDVSRAIHFAHQRGVLHRDLKPANILIDRESHALVADFGLAKRLLEDSQITQAGALVGTPNYMAPEQASGHSVTTAADIYGLGAILYECLTGIPPFDGENIFETLENLKTKEPKAPSSIRKQIPLDLETICLKCLSKDPVRRYSSGEELARDLERYLAREPIQARPIGVLTRMRLWARRRPALAALIAVCMLAALALGALASWSHVQLRRSNDRLVERGRHARDAASLYRKAVKVWLLDEPHGDENQKRVLHKFLEMLREVAVDTGQDEELLNEWGQTLALKADIHRLLGELPEGKEAYEEAIDVQRRLLALAPRGGAFRLQLAETIIWYGELLREEGRRLDIAESLFSEAIDHLERINRRRGTAEVRREWARALYSRGVLRMDTNRSELAKKDLVDSRDMAQALVDNLQQGTPEDRHHLARSQINLGVLFRRNGHSDLAVENFRGAVKLLDGLHKEWPTRPVYRSELAAARMDLGHALYERNQPLEAQEQHQQALEIARNVAKDFPMRPMYQNNVANILNSLGSTLYKKGDPRDITRSLWVEARTLQQRLVDQWPKVAEYQFRLGMTTGNLGWLTLEQDQKKEAITLLEQGIASIRQAITLNPEHPGFIRGMRHHAQSLCEAHLLTGVTKNAAEAAELLVGPVRDRNPEDLYTAACFLARTAAVADRDPLLPPQERKPLSQAYAQRAVRLLDQAIQLGLTKGADQVRDAAPFAFVREEPAFKALIDRLPERAPAH